MANILDYLRWRGDLLLTERAFNEVDNLILSHLAYAAFDGIVPTPESGGTVRLWKAAERYDEAGIDQTAINQDPGPLLRQAAGSARFRDLRIGYYVNRVDKERQIQFCAMTCLLPDDTIYVAFRGTDNTIVGWREDFNTTFLARTPGQQAAVDYINAVAGWTDEPLRVGGHSKGGNLALYAAAFCEKPVQERILQVFSNDGPGFKDDLLSEHGYLAILPKARLILPEASLVGLLLSNRLEPQIIQSSASGTAQHNPYTWQVEGTSFVSAEGRRGLSQLMDDTLDRWNNTLTDEQRQTVITGVFDSMEASGVTTISEINANRWVCYNAILKAIRALDPEVQRQIRDSLKKSRPSDWR